MKKYFKIISVVLVSFLLFTACGKKSQKEAINNKDAKQSDKKEQKYELPPFSFTDEDGNEVRPEDFKGKTTIIVFWQTSCTYCRKELPEFAELQKRRDDVQIVPVAVGQEPGDVKKFLEENSIDLVSYYDRNYEAAKEIGVTGFPFNLYVDKEGNFVGAVPGYTDIKNVEKLLDQIGGK